MLVPSSGLWSRAEGALQPPRAGSAPAGLALPAPRSGPGRTARTAPGTTPGTAAASRPELPGPSGAAAPGSPALAPAGSAPPPHGHGGPGPAAYLRQRLRASAGPARPDGGCRERGGAAGSRLSREEGAGAGLLRCGVAEGGEGRREVRVPCPGVPGAAAPGSGAALGALLPRACRLGGAWPPRQLGAARLSRLWAELNVIKHKKIQCLSPPRFLCPLDCLAQNSPKCSHPALLSDDSRT